jgi:hypothetical protein
MPIKFTSGYESNAAGTAYGVLIPPVPGKIPYLHRLRYTCAATEHILYGLRCVSDTTIAENAAAGQKDIKLVNAGTMQTEAGADEQLAANDFICWQSQYGVFNFDSIASISGTTVTMTSNLPTKSEAGAIVYCFGEIARATNETLRFTVSSENDWTDIYLQGGAPGQKTRHARSGQNDPLLIHIDNASNAGFLHQVVALYADAADVTM